ncbi:hypothetical protein MMC20_006565 [Loxospora ochrophaea]|nr:hypothetical protein [Loxospora ochrophaea]
MKTDSAGHTSSTSGPIIVGPGGIYLGGTLGLPVGPPSGGLKCPAILRWLCGSSDSSGSNSGPDIDPNDEGEPDNNKESKISSQVSSTASKSSTSSSSASCTAIETASDCSVFCGTQSSATVQSCSTTCYSTVTGCSITGTTTTSSIGDSCPLTTDSSGSTITGCITCSWINNPLPTSSDLGYGPGFEPEDDGYEQVTQRKRAARAIAGRTTFAPMITPEPGYLQKRDNPTSKVKAIGPNGNMCELLTPDAASPVTRPAWTGGNTWLDSDLANNVEETQRGMVRWYTSTSTGDPACTPILTVINAQEMEMQGNLRGTPTIDHVWEKGWMNEWWVQVVGTGENQLSCPQINEVFFKGNCPGNRMAPIWDAMPGDSYWDMIGMSLGVNNDCKGMLADGQRVAKQVANQVTKKAVSSSDTWKVMSKKFRDKLDLLKNIALGCSLWSSADVSGPLEASNNRIYNSLLAVDAFTLDDSNGISVKTNLGPTYKNWMSNELSTLPSQANEQAVRLVTAMTSDIQIINAVDEGQLPTIDAGLTRRNINNQFNALKTKYHLGDKSSSVCSFTIDLNWNIQSLPRDLLTERADSCALPNSTSATLETSTSSLITSKTSLTSPTTAAPVSCTSGNNILMGENNSPSSWCFCNGQGPFAILPSATSNYCAYTTLPTAIISLTSHSTTATFTGCKFTTTSYPASYTYLTGVQSYCTCGEEIVGIGTTTYDGTTASWCETGSGAAPTFPPTTTAATTPSTTSSASSAPPLTTTPTPVQSQPSTSTTAAPSCTQVLITGGRAGIIGRDCDCSDGSHPSPSIVNGEYTCPNQVRIIP